MGLVIGLVIFIIIIFIIRAIGAWMLRIDEVITNQKAILAELKKSNFDFNGSRRLISRSPPCPPFSPWFQLFFFLELLREGA